MTMSASTHRKNESTAWAYRRRCTEVFIEYNVELDCCINQGCIEYPELDDTMKGWCGPKGPRPKFKMEDSRVVIGDEGNRRTAGTHWSAWKLCVIQKEQLVEG